MESIKKYFAPASIIAALAILVIATLRLRGDSPTLGDMSGMILGSAGLVLGCMFAMWDYIEAALKKLAPQTGVNLNYLQAARNYSQSVRSEREAPIRFTYVTQGSHLLRVIEEQADLRERLAKLDAFILDNPVFLGLPEADRKLLERQSKLMGELTEILAARIERLGKLA